MHNIKAVHLETHREKMIGLLGKDKAIPIYFKTHFGIHTFGMKFPIDVLILDDTNKVVKKVENLSPNRIFIWSPVYERVLELPSGFIAHRHFNTGDEVTIEQ
jgi:uncharacterized membrane protein (UPF0127 family)